MDVESGVADLNKGKGAAPEQAAKERAQHNDGGTGHKGWLRFMCHNRFSPYI